MTADSSPANANHAGADTRTVVASGQPAEEPGLIQTVGPWIAFLLTLASPLYPFGLYILQRELENQHGLGSNTAWYLAAQVPASVTVTQAVEALLAPSVPYILIAVLVGALSDPLINTALPWLRRRASRDAGRQPPALHKRTPLAISILVAFLSTASYLSGEHVVLWISILSGALAAIAAASITIGIRDSLVPAGRFVAGAERRSSIPGFFLTALLFVYLSVLAPVVFATAPNDLPLVTITTKGGKPFDGARIFVGEVITHADGRWYILNCLKSRGAVATDLLPESVVASVALWPRHPATGDRHLDLHGTTWSQLVPGCLRP